MHLAWARALLRSNVPFWIPAAHYAFVPRTGPTPQTITDFRHFDRVAENREGVMEAEAASEMIHSWRSEKDLDTEINSVPFNTQCYQQLARNGSDPDLNPSLSASTECLAEGLRD